jgi:hypothetical protein
VTLARRAARWLAFAVLACATLGCLHRRGDWAPRAKPDAGPNQGVTFVLLGNAGWDGRGAAVVANQLEHVLDEAPASNAAPVVLWLGNNVMARRRDDRRLDCRDARKAWNRKGVDRLSAVVRAHLARGGESFAVAGEHDWRCHMAVEQQQDQAGAHPWRMPATHYVVRVEQDGRTDVVSTCSDGACSLESREAPALIELVMVDATPWLYRDLMDQATADLALRELSSLVEALEATPVETTPPRILVSHFPIEAAGWHGQGGGRPDSTWPVLHPALRRALAAGMFVGVFAAHDLGLYADADLGSAIKRSDRVWLPSPLFQVVSGSTSVRATGLRRLRHFGSVTLWPDHYAPDLGFATVRLDENTVEITLHARRLGRWRTSALSFPLRRPPHPHETHSPAMPPCLRCPEIPPNERP